MAEILSGSYRDYSIVFPELALRDTRPLCALLFIYPPIQMSFLYVIYRGYQDHPLFPNFKPVTNDLTTRSDSSICLDLIKTTCLGEQCAVIDPKSILF